MSFADLKGNITYVNQAFIKLFSYTDKSEIIGSPISKFASNDDDIENIIACLKRGEVYHSNSKTQRKEGSPFYSMTSTSSVIHDKATLCYMTVFFNINDLKLLELDLKKSKAELSKLNKDKDKFFAIIAHDLRSPFNGILGLLDILSSDYDLYDDEERRKMIQAAYSSSQKAFMLLVELLEWAKLQTKKTETTKQSVKISHIVDENIGIHNSNAQSKNILIKNNILDSSSVDLHLNSINTVIRNLLTNAIKFTPNGGHISFDLKNTNGFSELIIKDTGIGMDSITIDKLFKLDEASTRPGTNHEEGSGLGLLITNEIVSKNKWEMNIESQVGAGTAITIGIPN